MSAESHHHDEDLARRVYSYFIFRLRQPEDAERLTRLSFERVWREDSVRRETDRGSDMRTFAAARAVIAENPRPREASRFTPGQGGEGRALGLSEGLTIAIGRLHGREREALALRFGARLSVGEIAELIERTPAEVKQRLARGVRTLRDLGVLPEEEPEPKSAERTRTRGPKGRDAQQQQPGE